MIYNLLSKGKCEVCVCGGEIVQQKVLTQESWLIKCCMGLCISRLKKQSLCRLTGITVKLDGKNEMGEMDGQGDLNNPVLYYVSAKLITRTQSMWEN